MPGEAEAEGPGLLLPAPSSEGVLRAPGSRRAEPCLHAWLNRAEVPFTAPSAAQQGLPVGQSLLCNVADGPGERGSSALTYGMSYTGSLLGNPVCEQSPAFLLDGMNNHCQWDWWWWLFISTRRSKRLCWKKWGWWSSACQGTPTATRDHCGLVRHTVFWMRRCCFQFCVTFVKLWLFSMCSEAWFVGCSLWFWFFICFIVVGVCLFGHFFWFFLHW